MPPPTLALIAPALSAAADPAWWKPIRSAWPTSLPAPNVELSTPEGLLSGRRAAPRGGLGVPDAAVLVLEGGVLDTLTCRLIDILEQDAIPVVILAKGRGPCIDRLEPGSVFVHNVDSDPAATAALLAALVARQPAVRGLDKSLRLAQSFQNETAGEIDRLHQELLLAAKVQRDFLPKHMPSVDGVDCGVLFRPAGFVSGDTYDISRLDEFHVGFFLADAMGHGVPAALMTLYISGSLPRREFTPDGTARIVPPAEGLRRLNADLHECIAGPTRFATAVCGVIDTRTGVIHLACAGHPPPLRISPRGVRPVDVSGMLLGVVPDYEFQQVSIRLEPDELLVVHSDGIETAFPGPAETGDPRTRVCPSYYADLARMRTGQSLDSLADAVEHLAVDLDRQTGSLHQHDDLTIMAFQTTSIRETRPTHPTAPRTESLLDPV
jgi:phosphoserine phosphatase RsbU/P